jgi:hypothetical protein
MIVVDCSVSAAYALATCCGDFALFACCADHTVRVGLF